MQNSKAQRKKPTYSIDAVDNALQLLQLLRDLGSVRLKDAATELNVAPSTAHRLLAMLVYRGFAIQDESKRYLPGPSLGVGPAGIGWTTQLRSIAQPHLELLAARLNETVNLMIRVGTQVRFLSTVGFLSTVEGSNILRIGDRQGTVLPANSASGSKAILAELDREVLEQLFRTSNADISGAAIPAADYPAFLQELDAIRTNGFAANFEGTEEGVSALGAAIHDAAGVVVGAISVAIPTTRFRKQFDAGLVQEVFKTRQALEADLGSAFSG